LPLIFAISSTFRARWSWLGLIAFRVEYLNVKIRLIIDTALDILGAVFAKVGADSLKSFQ
jgi:hypothetical protein